MIWIETERLVLRNVAAKDADTMYDYRNNTADADWGNSKDSIERSVWYLTTRKP